MQEIRAWFSGLVALSGSIGHGRAILAAQALGADFAYIGSPWIATSEANAPEGYKEGIVGGNADGIVYTNLFTGVHGNYLRSSIEASGMDPDNLPVSDPSKMNFGSGGNTKGEGVERHLGLGPGHRHRDRGRPGRGDRGPAGGRIPRRQGRSGRDSRLAAASGLGGGLRLGRGELGG